MMHTQTHTNTHTQTHTHIVECWSKVSSISNLKCYGSCIFSETVGRGVCVWTLTMFLGDHLNIVCFGVGQLQILYTSIVDLVFVICNTSLTHLVNTQPFVSRHGSGRTINISITWPNAGTLKIISGWLAHYPALFICLRGTQSTNVKA